MKREISLIAVMALGLAAALYAPAQAHDIGGMEGSSGWHHGGRGKEALGLSEDQITKLKAIHESRKTAMKPLWRKQRDLSIRLKDSLQDKASDSQIKSILTDMRSNKEAMKTLSKRFHDEKNSVLTPTQQAQMMLWNKRRHHRDGRSERGWTGRHKTCEGKSSDGADGHDEHHDDERAE